MQDMLQNKTAVLQLHQGIRPDHIGRPTSCDHRDSPANARKVTMA
jgi:hypothetical protein